MRRNRRRNGDVAIDLTSLLDVIFIILLVVLCYASSLSDNAKSQQEDLDRQIESADNARNAYSDMVEEADALTEYVGMILVRIPPDSKDYTKRTIILLEKDKKQENGENELVSYLLEGNNTSTEFDSLRSSIEKYIEDHSGRPVIISINDEDTDILYRDEKAVIAMTQELQKKYDNVYVK